MLATKRKEKKRIKYTFLFVSLTITPERVKKWYYNQVATDRTPPPLLLIFLFVSKHTKHDQGWQDQQKANAV